MLQAIFYARFHPERGPELFSQWPPDLAIFQGSTGSPSGLLDFSVLSTFLVPPQDLANRALSVCASGYRVLGFPISLEGAHYPRNRFAFNVCLVLGESLEKSWVKSWEAIVAKLARFMRDLEANGSTKGLLSREESIRDAGGEETGVVSKVLQGVFGDLVEYGECCVRVSMSHVLNLRLTIPSTDVTSTPKVRDWDVPLFIRSLQSSDYETLDLVLAQIAPHVNGVSHVKKIAQLADVHLPLARRAIRALVRSGHAMILDIFHFQAVYQLTADFAYFASDAEMGDECREFITIDPADNIFAPSWDADMRSRAAETGTILRTAVIDLYSAVDGANSVAEFCAAHGTRLYNIDIRRFFTFGVIKGFIKRRHKYAMESSASDIKDLTSNAARWKPEPDPDRAWRDAAFSSGWATPPVHSPKLTKDSLPSNKQLRDDMDAKLVKYLDGQHCIDQICVELGMTEKAILARLRSGAFVVKLFADLTENIHENGVAEDENDIAHIPEPALWYILSVDDEGSSEDGSEYGSDLKRRQAEIESKDIKTKIEKDNDDRKMKDEEDDDTMDTDSNASDDSWIPIGEAPDSGIPIFLNSRGTLKRPKLTMATNVFNVGICIMNMMNQHSNATAILDWESALNDGTPRFSDAAVAKYSRVLMRTVRACVRYRPNDQCTFTDLKARVNRHTAGPTRLGFVNTLYEWKYDRAESMRRNATPMNVATQHDVGRFYDPYAIGAQCDPEVFESEEGLLGAQ
ncbi:Nitrogen permease regulator 2 [Oleoguttula sp. CCFEE 5521]